MRIIDVIMPTDLGCQVHGSLIASNDPRDLGEDMVDVLLPNGLLISAGWFPESDPKGGYRLTVANGLNRFAGPFYLDDVEQTKDALIDFAISYSSGVVRVSATDTTNATDHNFCRV